MKELIKISKIILTAFCFTLLLTSASAQRGYRNQYPPRFSHRYYGAPQQRFSGSLAYGYPRYSALPRASVTINFGGNPYYYHGGSFYRPYGGYYRTVFPPAGIRISVLPFGYIPLFVGPNPYYFYGGTYYHRYHDNSYEVVDAPMGAQLSSLPLGAKAVLVNGEKFYELNGTYYKEDRDAKGRTVYTVTGKDGQIDNTPQPPATPGEPAVGERISQLPGDCRTIILNGEKLYVSPDDTYYRAETDGTYTVVGVPGTGTL